MLYFPRHHFSLKVELKFLSTYSIFNMAGFGLVCAQEVKALRLETESCFSLYCSSKSENFQVWLILCCRESGIFATKSVLLLTIWFQCLLSHLLVYAIPQIFSPGIILIVIQSVCVNFQLLTSLVDFFKSDKKLQCNCYLIRCTRLWGCKYRKKTLHYNQL